MLRLALNSELALNREFGGEERSARGVEEILVKSSTGRCVCPRKRHQRILVPGRSQLQTIERFAARVRREG